MIEAIYIKWEQHLNRGGGLQNQLPLTCKPVLTFPPDKHPTAPVTLTIHIMGGWVNDSHVTSAILGS